MNAVLEPFGYEFFVNGCIVATVAGGLCGMTGVFITLRGMSYIGHGLSHAVFGGFAAASLIQINYYLGAGVWGLFSAWLINRVARKGSIGSDAAIGVVTTASFALGVALLTLFGSRGPSFEAALFGSIIGVRDIDVWVVCGVTVVAGAVIVRCCRAFLFATFDPDVADAAGFRVARLDALLMALLSLAILATLTVIGVTLVAATLVVPAVTARLLAPAFAFMLPYATVVGAVTGFTGMNISYHADVPSGTMIVLVGAGVFALAYWLGGRARRTTRPAA
jgi:manganese/iron transport system permease protein/iron/zinc/copper transport system permease protein